MKVENGATGRAHAKLILVGEHFVVPSSGKDGNPRPGSSALAIPLPELRTDVQITAAGHLSCELTSSIPEAGFGEDVSVLMERSLRLAADRFQWDLSKQPLRMSSRTNFAPSRGLGSSASFSVALVRAFCQLSKETLDVRNEAQQIENLFHGKSSGLDTSAIATGAPILYRDGVVQRKFSPVAVDIVIADSGPRGSSSALVGRTMKLRTERPDFWASLSQNVTELAETCVAHLENPGGAAEVARIIEAAQGILAEIGLTSEALKNLLRLGRRAGALAGKLSGAGAGGVALFVAHRGEGRELAARMTELGAKVVTIA